jgi:hypothetical protein
MGEEPEVDVVGNNGKRGSRESDGVRWERERRRALGGSERGCESCDERRLWRRIERVR